MTKVQTKHVILSAALAVCTVLAACAKPGDGNRVTKSENPSPSSNPLKAAVENKKDEQAAAADAAKKDDKGAEGADVSSATASGADKQTQDAQKRASLDALTNILKSEAQPQAATDGGVPTSESGGAAASTSEGPQNIGQSLAVDSAVPAAAQAASDLNTPAQIVGSKDTFSAEQKALVLSLIKPAMIENGAIWLQRQRILKLAETYFTKDQKEEDAKFLSDLRKEYGLADNASFDELLENVDIVHMPFLIALMVNQHGWTMQDEKGLQDTKFLYSAMAKQMQILNTANDEENIRFRKARAAMRKADNIDSADLMTAYVGAAPADRTARQRRLTSIVGATKMIFATADVQKEIDAVQMKIRSQEIKVVKAQQ